MVNINKVSENMEKYSEHVLERLDKEIKELKNKSVAVAFDKVLTKRLKK